LLRAQQPGKHPRLAILLFNSPSIDPIGPLLKGLQSLGYVDGKSIAIDYRYAEGNAERLEHECHSPVGPDCWGSGHSDGYGNDLPRLNLFG